MQDCQSNRFKRYFRLLIRIMISRSLLKSLKLRLPEQEEKTIKKTTIN